jgi:hypothetical protein
MPQRHRLNALSLPPLAAPKAGAAGCPKANAANAAASVSPKGKFLTCHSMGLALLLMTSR